ncbi:maltose ABC transporter substrate-binding protein [Acholeplasma laidlawii]|uniref:ABC-type transport system, ligand-binding component n=2 Tax=Acholeplasma laidlawii TaxID=2148 RepID=A9NFZ7_ACHLI|nr:maltose ABC transporter substrate-binding protein [Acholeplasma laidlawii]ABX81277.1 ABC-type transport system, ligand-binding component [Acholeplasma laidlawii PG-8A]NWH10146.1 maltose ABC transporter substrate-binding protein [Acholeplasma laidlawii]NWH11536.1 maltose ABC transporter substrate-binding protein [Acholeplasma laidlawii]NWH13054.1 maltose ABC transporter substrate-binding protein [Acholeplasma laidlawii]NWH14678.1 maltose ABC transporter substrate-binding protein [Acholeplasm
MKKTFTSILMIMFVLFVVACTPKAKNDGAEYDFSEIYKEKQTITVWIDDQNGEYMQAVIAEFNKTDAGKDIIVQHQHMGTVDARERLKTFGLTGNGADIFQFPHDHLASAILEDLVYALPSSVATRVAERAHPLGMDIATLLYDESTGVFGPGANAQENVYAVPMSLEAIGLYYNKDLVSTPAATMEELLAAAATWNAALASDGSGQTNAQKGWYYLGTSSHWADSYFMQTFYSALGFQPFGENLDDPSAVGFADAVAALTWFRDKLKPATTGNNNHNSVGAGANFVAGNIPYIIAGPWNIEEYAGTEGLNFGIAPLPSVGGVQGAPFAGAQMAAIYKYSNNKEAATAFLEFLMSDKAMELQLKMKNKLPALKPELLPNIDGFSTDPYLPAISLQLESAIPMPTIPAVQYYWGPGESMIISVWNNPATVISEAVVAAENAYRAQAGLGGQ